MGGDKTKQSFNKEKYLELLQFSMRFQQHEHGTEDHQFFLETNHYDRHKVNDQQSQGNPDNDGDNITEAVEVCDEH